MRSKIEGSSLSLAGCLLAVTMLAAACSSPTASQEGTGPGTGTGTGGSNPPGPSSVILVITGVSQLLVHQRSLFTVTAKDARGAQVTPPRPLTWMSGDTTIATISSDGVVTPLRRGSTTIGVRAGGATVAVSLTVKAQVRIAPGYLRGFSSVLPIADSWPMAIGDTLRFTASYADVDGNTIDENPSVAWSSSNPAGISVSPTGLVTGVQPFAWAVIAALTDDGTDTIDVTTTDVIAGQPATIRFAHTALGVGPVTFQPSKGGPVTLSYGESVELPILSGVFWVQAQGFPAGDSARFGFRSSSNFAAMIRGGDHLSVFAVGGATQAFLTAAWASHLEVPPESGLVRLVQGWNPAPVVYLRPPGAPMSGTPQLCYFDPADVSEYFRFAAGDLDMILQAKYGGTPGGVGSEFARVGVSAPAGRSVTYVITGDTPGTMGVLAFPDP